MRDGVPQNDPFGGWVNWARYTPDLIALVEILPPSQSMAWGAQSAGGMIHLISEKAPENRIGTFRAMAGTSGQRSAAVFAGTKTGPLEITTGLHHLRNNGPMSIHPEDRGPIDQAQLLELTSLDLTGQWIFNDKTRSQLLFNTYEEERQAGTPLSGNRSEATDAAWKFSHSLEGDQGLQGLLYYQDRTHENRFTSVNAPRTAENVVLDQFDIPASAFGGHFIWSSPPDRTREYLAGMDFRQLSGETNEDYGFGLSSRRKAGGDQRFTGLFGKLVYRPAPLQSVFLNLRVDRWEVLDGFLREEVLATGEVTVAERYDDRSSTTPNASLSWTTSPAHGVQWLIGASSAFRLPTVNELYRPFRVGSDITAANPDLDPKRFYTLETSLKLSPVKQLQVEGGVDVTWISDAITNVYLFSGPSDSPGGVVPAGGSYNQRRNIESARVERLTLGLRWRMMESLHVRADYRLARSVFSESPDQPLLEGREFPHIPLHRGNVSLIWAPSPGLECFISSQFSSHQFDDPLNTRALSGYGRLDAGARFLLSESTSLTLRLANAFDKTILTGESGTGVRQIAEGREFWMGLRIEL